MTAYNLPSDSRELGEFYISPNISTIDTLVFTNNGEELKGYASATGFFTSFDPSENISPIAYYERKIAYLEQRIESQKMLCSELKQIIENALFGKNND